MRSSRYWPIAAIGLAAWAAVAGCGASGAGNSAATAGRGTSGRSATGAGSGAGGASLLDGGTGAGTGAGGGSGMPFVTIDDCPGPLSAPTVAALQAGGPTDPAMKWLYPYDTTVFPGGLLPPDLQWAPQAGGADGVYLHLRSARLDYKACFGPASPALLGLPATGWAAAFAQSGGAVDPLDVELTTIAGGKVSGPIKETWVFAKGSLKGSVYYNTYSSPQVVNNGAVMRIQPGASAPTAFLSIPGTSPVGPCISCHSLSSNGSFLVAQRHQYPGGLVQSESYDLSKTPVPNPASPLATTLTDDWGFGALYPDGSRLLTDGAPGTTGGLFPAGQDNNPGMIGPKASVFYDPSNATVVTPKGWTATYAKMPMFSPDGKHIVFNQHENGNGHTLVVMDYDRPSDTFSNLRPIFTHPVAYPGWPFFTPDGKSVVFVLGNAWNYASLYPPTGPVQNGDLYIVDVASGTLAVLSAANGYAASTSYLPYPGRDEHYNFYPTVSPVAAGGYSWVFFTSRRNYGNTVVGAVDDPKSKKIWVSALDLGATPGQDPSHPAFYLPGQEVGSGNIRAFATLDPCKANGAGCTSGIDCCGGFCTNGLCAPPQGCAHLDEKCATGADCCDKTEECIGGFCSQTMK